TWLRDKITLRIDANARETDALVRSEAAKHRHALAQVITWTTMVVVYCATAILVAERLGIPLTSLVAPAAVVAVALGFGAQRIVQDLLAGFFIIAERQYGFGDLVRLAVPAGSSGSMGTVEDVTLRITTVRTADGEVVITPNGQIGQVTNLSRGWARAVVDVPVPATVDVNRVSDLLRKVGEEAYTEPDLRQLLLDPPTVMGVQSIDVTQFQVRMVARTLPGMQFDVSRMLRSRVAAGLLREGISLPASVEPVGPNGAA
ncbi:MAG: mechanosensitive ion channel family protein, partial [Actinobacteria bacterium]|nr:mechanosensitive ion channel family protein [Actinomycetota bacterium]